MGRLKLIAKELRAIGFPEGPAISLAMQVMEKQYRFEKKEVVMNLLKRVLASPVEYSQDAILAVIAEKLMPPAEKEPIAASLNKSGIQFNVFGSEHIEEGAMHQMYTAAKLPISVAGALMPDAHAGYGLPIGGVLATRDSVIPYGVGVDIGCRMCLSIFDIAPKELTQREQQFARILDESTLFGSGAQFKQASNHAVMEDPLFQQLPLLKNMHGRTWKQLGTSGSGNHFVEFGTVVIEEKDEVLRVEPGHYLGLLSHSGSRALGAKVANHYTSIAISKRRLPAEAKNLAWLMLDEEEGTEYWLAMNLAGDYAKACHDVIHAKVARELGRKPVRMVENHHNFAWKEKWEDQDVIVHRKGATPAGQDVLGIIPGSMTADGFIVKGKGESAAVNSASHGAGRRMSRGAAMQSITHAALKDELRRTGVKLMGGGLDEAPFAYKNIHEVMKSQKQLVTTIGRFTPRIVKMDG